MPSKKTSSTGGSEIAYCVKCKKSQTMVNSKKAMSVNKRHMLKGECKVCGTKMNKFVSA